MSDQPSWSVPGGPPPPPPTGAPYDVAPPPGVPGPAPYGAPYGPSLPPLAPPPRRRTGLKVTAAVLGVLVLGAAAGVAAAHGRTAPARPVAAPAPSATSPAGGTPSPSTTASPSTPASPSPTSAPAIGRAPDGPPLASVVAAPALGALGAALQARHWGCTPEHTAPTIVSCARQDGDGYVRWLGDGDRPQALVVDTDGTSAAGLGDVLSQLPSATGWTAADTAVARAAAAKGVSRDLTLAWGSGHLDVSADTGLDLYVERADAPLTAPPVLAQHLGGLPELGSTASAHGYACTAPSTSEGLSKITCTKGDRTIELSEGSGAQDGQEYQASGSRDAVEDLLGLLAAFRESPSEHDAPTITTLVRSVEDRGGVVAGSGWVAACDTDTPLTCTVDTVTW